MAIDSTASNNVSCYTTTVPSGTLPARKSVWERAGGAGAASDGSVDYGTAFQYEIAVTATGADQPSVIVTDVLDPALTYQIGATCSASGCVVTYDAATRSLTANLGTVASGSTQTVRFTVMIAAPARTAAAKTTVAHVAAFRSPPHRPRRTP